MKNRKKNSKWTFQHTRSDFFSLDVFPPSGNFCHVDKDTFLNIDFFGGMSELGNPFNFAKKSIALH